jgi:hypothetical protein
MAGAPSPLAEGVAGRGTLGRLRRPFAGAVTLSAGVLIGFGCATSTFASKVRTEEGVSRVVEGTALNGRLWLRTKSRERNALGGSLISIALAGQPIVHVEAGVLDIDSASGKLLVMRRRSPDAKTVVVSEVRSSGLSDVVPLALPRAEAPVALASRGSTIAVLTDRSLLTLAAGETRWEVKKLDAPIRRGIEASVAWVGRSLYVGTNKGEWGGGLQMVDTDSGMVQEVERSDGDAPCAGPLNRRCSPVTGVIREPASQCILASVGLVHLSLSRGRILRVCGGHVTVVFEVQTSAGESVGNTEAFFGLAVANEGFWAIGNTSVLHFGLEGLRRYPLPAFERLDVGVRWSSTIPGVAVVMTDVNWSVSTSGPTGLVVAL